MQRPAVYIHGTARGTRIVRRCDADIHASVVEGLTEAMKSRWRSGL